MKINIKKENNILINICIFAFAGLFITIFQKELLYSGIQLPFITKFLVRQIKFFKGNTFYIGISYFIFFGILGYLKQSSTRKIVSIFSAFGLISIIIYIFIFPEYLFQIQSLGKPLPSTTRMVNSIINIYGYSLYFSLFAWTCIFGLIGFLIGNTSIYKRSPLKTTCYTLGACSFVVYGILIAGIIVPYLK